MAKLTRTEHLKFCQFCCNRKFTPSKGIICNLTGNWADFDGNCKDYTKDELAIKNQLIFNENKHSAPITDSTFGLEKLGIKNGILASFILLSVGLAWLLTGLYYGVLFYYSLIIILFGLLALSIGIINKFKRRHLQK